MFLCFFGILSEIWGIEDAFNKNRTFLYMKTKPLLWYRGILTEFTVLKLFNQNLYNVQYFHLGSSPPI